MSRIMVVYGTTEGHTATIVEQMREAMEAGGHEVDAVRAGKPLPEISDGVDGVIVGASIHAGKASGRDPGVRKGESRAARGDAVCFLPGVPGSRGPDPRIRGCHG